MDKKILMPIALMLLVFGAVLVSAYTIEYATTINKGWNLVYGFTNPDQIQGIEPSNIKAIFGFDATTQTYVRFYPNPETTKINNINNEQLRNTAFWVYSNAETGENFNDYYNAVEYWIANEPLAYNQR
jgi:hypothetical protein